MASNFFLFLVLFFYFLFILNFFFFDIFVFDFFFFFFVWCFEHSSICSCKNRSKNQAVFVQIILFFYLHGQILLKNSVLLVLILGSGGVRDGAKCSINGRQAQKGWSLLT